MKEISVARNELKYVLDPVRAARLAGTLGLILDRDPMGGPAGYSVRSLYFDTLDDSDYQDKIDGLESRQKVRIRIYTPEDKTAKLELKRKIGAHQWKRSVTLTREQARRVIAGDYAGVQAELDAPFPRQLLSMMELNGYQPKTVVEFRRLAFVANADNTRVTFDSDLRASQSLSDLFTRHPAYHIIDHPLVLEVKYTHYLMSHIKFALGLADEVPVSVSKYCLGQQISFY
ncbi:MAG: polyphosphate polymerase domain-containing protein [Planctomycetes bacterium]|nr:polyphosphate polymerase domain-containing protein [Planctomycetota bacterium]